VNHKNSKAPDPSDRNDDASIAASPYAFTKTTGVGQPMDGTDPEVIALRALLERPSFSIRYRLAIGFLFLFLVSAAIAITSIVTLNYLEQKVHFLEDADIITNKLQKARRYEKNFLLYGSDLPVALENVEDTERLLASSKIELGEIVGKDRLQAMQRHLERYQTLINRLSELELKGKAVEHPDYAEIVQELRAHGHEAVEFAQEMAKRERDKVNLMIRFFRWAPIVFLIVLLALMVYQANFLYSHIIKRLNRLMETTRRVANGDFTLIVPQRRYRDEFTNLAVAMNSMMRQLKHRHDILVRSHKLRAVGTLAAGVAHELNNPINNIMLTAESLKEYYADLSDSDGPQLEMVEDLVSQAERSQKIVRNLLDFARESEIEHELLEVGEIIQETLVLTANQIKLHSVKAKVEIAPNLPSIHGDKQHLIQVLFNLILNALDAMLRGGELEIAAKRADDPAFVEVCVTDTGTGIPEHAIGSIFDPFFTTKPTGKGTGLGLSVSLGIVKKHGGDIRVKSVVNEGTTFTVLLPVSTIPADMANVNFESD
jgi:two-component system NtrC family sensor kinase